jgi:hypothetical protein
LAHRLFHRVACVCQFIAGRRNDADAKLDQRKDARLLRHEIASEAAGVLDYHNADAVAFDPVKQAVEARARLDRISGAVALEFSLDFPEHISTATVTTGSSGLGAEKKC